MKRFLLLLAAPLALAACQDTLPPEPVAPELGADFSVVQVPGDYTSVQAAIDAASTGDTVLLAPGTYVGPLTIRKAITLASRYITTSDASYVGSTILDGGGGDAVITIPAGSEPGAVIQGVTIQNAGDGVTAGTPFMLSHCRVWDTSDGADIEDGSGGLVEHCTFELNSDDGIDLDRDVDVVIADNVIRDNGDDGIEVRLQSYEGPTLGIVITRNRIYRNEEDGIQLIGYDDRTDRLFEITCNLIHDNDYAGIGIVHASDTHEAFQAHDLLESVYVFGNTFANNDHGISGGDSIVVLNNIFVGHPGIGVKGVDGGSALAYNLFFDNGTDASGSNVDAGTTFTADPLLDADWGLLAGSPAIDAGTAFFTWMGRTVLDLSPEDYDGVAPDLGAFESEGASVPPPDAPVLQAPPDGSAGVGLTPTLSWTGEAVSFTVEVATDTDFVDIVDTGVVPANEYDIPGGALDHLTTYVWRVRGSNEGGHGEYSATWSFTTEEASAPPTPPTLGAPVDGAVDVPLSPTLAWTGAADEFDVQVSTDAAFEELAYETTTTATSAVVPDGTLLYETTYLWRVRGKNVVGAGEYSSAFRFTTLAEPDGEPPSRPENLRSPAQTSSTVELLWDPSTDNVGVVSYRVYRDGTLIGDAATPGFTATGLTPATAYTFAVSALDEAGNESERGSSLAVSTEPVPQPQIHVAGVSMQLRSNRNWNTALAVVSIADGAGDPVDGATVEIRWEGLVSGSDVASTSAGLATFASDRISASETGRFLLEVTDVRLAGHLYDPTTNVASSGCIESTGAPCGPPDLDPPAPPAALAASGGPGSVSLTWSASGEADLDAYSVYRSTSAGTGHALIADDLGTNGYDDREVTPGTTYYYVVTATDLSGNESDPSVEASATPSEPVQATVHVARIDPALVTRGVNVLATMSVSVSDAAGAPVPGARVDGSWTLNGVGLGAAGGDTDGAGAAFVESPKVKAESGDIFTFAVTNVVAGGATYRPDQNLETSDSIAVP